MVIPSLTTPRLILRPFKFKDALPLHRILVEPGVLRYFPNPSPPTVKKVRNLITQQIDHWTTRGYGWWVVEQPEHNELMGWCGLQYLPETGETEIGYLLGKAHWGKGYATEAASATLRFGFENLAIEKIIAVVHPENTASTRVLEKLGFRDPIRTSYFGMDCLRYLAERNTITVGKQN